MIELEYYKKLSIAVNDKENRFCSILLYDYWAINELLECRGIVGYISEHNNIKKPDTHKDNLNFCAHHQLHLSDNQIIGVSWKQERDFCKSAIFLDTKKKKSIAIQFQAGLFVLYFF